MFRRIDRFLDLLERAVAVLEFWAKFVPRVKPEVVETIETGLYRANQDSLDEYMDERNNRRYAELDNPYKDVDFNHGR